AEASCARSWLCRARRAASEFAPLAEARDDKKMLPPNSATATIKIAANAGRRDEPRLRCGLFALMFKGFIKWITPGQESCDGARAGELRITGSANVSERSHGGGSRGPEVIGRAALPKACGRLRAWPVFRPRL